MIRWLEARWVLTKWGFWGEVSYGRWSVSRLLAALMIIGSLGIACGADRSFQSVAEYQAVSVGSVFTCSLSVGGQVRCWGQDEAHDEKGLTDAPARGAYKAISSGYYGSCALRDSGRLKCWGRVDGMTPLRKFSAVDMGWSDVCAIREAHGRLQCWGRDGGGVSRVPGGAFVNVSVSSSYACAVRTDGTLECWGDLASREEMAAPDGVFRTVSVGLFGACGLLDDGRVECWGHTEFWELPDPPLGVFDSVDVGNGHACGVRPVGAIECWGRDAGAELEPPDAKFLSVSAGSGRTCGITHEHQVVCWGKSFH